MQSDKHVDDAGDCGVSNSDAMGEDVTDRSEGAMAKRGAGLNQSIPAELTLNPGKYIYNRSTYISRLHVRI